MVIEGTSQAAGDLEWVQVLTGLDKPDDPDVKIKFLAVEALRGVEVILLNSESDRFVNELGRRDYVTGEVRIDLAYVATASFLVLEAS